MWLNPDAVASKQHRRRLERRWKKFGGELNRVAYRAACRRDNMLINASRNRSRGRQGHASRMVSGQGPTVHWPPRRHDCIVRRGLVVLLRAGCVFLSTKSTTSRAPSLRRWWVNCLIRCRPIGDAAMIPCPSSRRRLRWRSCDCSGQCHPNRRRSTSFQRRSSSLAAARFPTY